MKKCIKCGWKKENEKFQLRNKKTGCRRNECQDCTNKRISEWCKKNPERKKQIYERFYEKHFEHHCKQCGIKFKPNSQSIFCSKKCNLLHNIKIGENDCWIWQNSLNESGYGKSCLNGDQEAAHRVSYKIFKGKIEKKLQVLHKCDVRSCINPDHLYLGTQKDNIRDMDERGRRNRNRKSKYSMKICKKCSELHDNGFTYLEISKKFKICFSTVPSLINRFLKFNVSD